MYSQIFQSQEVKYYFLKKNLANYQAIGQIFSKIQLLIVIWKDQVQYSPMENTVLNEFSSYYAYENKSDKISEYQPDELNDNLIKNNHEDCFYSKNLIC